MIYGASGAIGTAALQLSKIYGAEVTAVVSTPHLELVRALGADYVVDYTTEDFTKIDKYFDFVLDAVGKSTFFRCRPLLKPRGVYSVTDLGPGWQNIWLALWSSLTRNGRVVMPMPRTDRPVIEFLSARMQAREFRAVIDRNYPLRDIADAYRYLETEQKAGIVVINVVPDVD
ncbi:MAG: zinc-binding dehydrogenase [Pirellulales bacterium]